MKMMFYFFKHLISEIWADVTAILFADGVLFSELHVIRYGKYLPYYNNIYICKEHYKILLQVWGKVQGK